MDKRTKGTIFSIMMFVVTLIGILLTIWLHFDQLPDPINVIAILTFSFGPLCAMLLYWVCKYKY